MLKRNRQIIVRLNDDEFLQFKKNISKTGLSQEAYLRILISKCIPKEKPDNRFYELMREISVIGNNLHQIARKANALGFIDVRKYNQVSQQLQDFQLEVRRRFLLPEKLE